MASLLFLTIATAFGLTAAAEAVELRLAHGSPRGHPNHEHADMLAAKINELTGGEVNVTVYGDRQLGDDGDMIQLVASGTVDMAYASSVNFPLTLNNLAFDALQLPGLIVDYDHLARTLVSEPAMKMLASLEASGLKGLCFSEGGRRNFLNRNGAITTVEDFKGLKTRIVPIPLHKAIWEAIGANPIGVPYGEVYTAMQTRVIDAVEFNVSSIFADKIYENAKYLTMTGHYFWPGLFFMNLETYNGLPEAQQTAISEACTGQVADWVAMTRDGEVETIDKLRAEGVEISEFPDRANLLALTAPVFEEWKAKDPLIGEYIEAAGQLE
jgi:tripartite ATP-independent transporter DctP family solute receptor